MQRFWLMTQPTMGSLIFIHDGTVRTLALSLYGDLIERSMSCRWGARWCDALFRMSADEVWKFVRSRWGAGIRPKLSIR